MSVHASVNQNLPIKEQADTIQNTLNRNSAATEECVKAHVAETSRLEDDDDACFDSIG